MSDPFVDLVNGQLDELIANVPEELDELDESTMDSFFTGLYRKVIADASLAAEFSGNQAVPFRTCPGAIELKAQFGELIKVVVPSENRAFIVQPFIPNLPRKFQGSWVLASGQIQLHAGRENENSRPCYQ
ncbi:hypothetical protein RSOLAG22IIIB_12283 [Rhizoctonia solani]|uniref:Uncharacterized protein n=1 Tax=Rhizoctonia solani TaxID=456999 RepID=A0A0K6GD63_9AGAM|nr:hypothetical protein RSOLAG22IIIB_12283 [Rhizoctonia solani]